MGVDKELEKLKSLLFYDDETGIFTRKNVKGRIAGTNRKRGGYIEIYVNNKSYSAHRLAWYLHYGEYSSSKLQIDHVDHDKRNNAICNLRLVTPSENQRNRKLNKNNTSGFNGVVFHKPSKTWFSFIRLKPGNKKWLGAYENIEDAISARKTANIKYGFHENHGKIITS